jgi:hypothetical protein
MYAAVGPIADQRWSETPGVAFENVASLHQWLQDTARPHMETVSRSTEREALRLATQRAHDFAYAHPGDRGLGLTRRAAQDFADRVSQRPDALAYVKRAQDTFAFAYRHRGDRGMHLTLGAARELALRVAERPDGSEYLKTLRGAFNDAFWEQRLTLAEARRAGIAAADRAHGAVPTS